MQDHFQKGFSKFSSPATTTTTKPSIDAVHRQSNLDLYYILFFFIENLIWSYFAIILSILAD